jgi:carbonic anhydrase
MNNSSCTSISSLFCKNKLPCECDCENNSRQSPIDIKRSTLNLGKTELLNVNYKTVSLYKYLDSDEYKYKPINDYILSFNTYTFKLLNVHFHKTSEHKIDGNEYDMEAHFVHKAIDTEEYVVLAFFINLVDENASDKNIDETLSLQDTATITMPDLGDDVFYTYKGSLTTGSFNSDVEWCVFEKPLEAYISKRDRFNHIGARPIQYSVYPSEVFTFTY